MGQAQPSNRSLRVRAQSQNIVAMKVSASLGPYVLHEYDGAPPYDVVMIVVRGILVPGGLGGSPVVKSVRLLCNEIVQLL
eukprot:scaffold299806_cov13-Prasinocladus_malaysianus.AAC.1